MRSEPTRTLGSVRIAITSVRLISVIIEVARESGSADLRERALVRLHEPKPGEGGGRDFECPDPTERVGRAVRRLVERGLRDLVPVEFLVLAGEPISRMVATTSLVVSLSSA